MKLFSTFLFLLWSSQILAQDENDYRLTETHYPVNYSINLVVMQSVFDGSSENYTGDTTIIFLSVENSTSIRLHSSPEYMTIKSIKIEGQLLDPQFYSVNGTTEILTINYFTIEGVYYKIDFEYDAILANDTYGFYRSSYMEDSVKKYLVTTQFESTRARRAFPCFDEPEYKANFTISITHPSSVNALSNSPIERNESVMGIQKTTFETTTSMSTYLVAFIVSEFNCTESERIENLTTPFRVCSRNTVESGSRDFAAEVGPKILRQLNTYTGIDYSNYSGKLDLVGIPDFLAGAMENWGLVTYREVYILWNQNESSILNKENVAQVIAHELAHMWFGNLVTTRWWDTIFLNEGFARLYQYIILGQLFPEWELDKLFIINQHHLALSSDDDGLSQPLQKDAFTAEAISARFNIISYSKGAAIIKMVQNFFQNEQNFHNGIKDYLRRRALNYSEPDILWAILQEHIGNTELPAQIWRIMENWVEYEGFPLLNVALSNGEVVISQEKYVQLGNISIQWYVPIHFKFANQTNAITWLVPNKNEKISLGNNNWILLNDQVQGYYRVNYDQTLWQRLATALQAQDFSGISAVGRSQIVSDVFNLASIGKIPYSKAFQYLEFLKRDSSYYSWFNAEKEFKFLLNKVGEESSLGKSILNHIDQWMTMIHASGALAQSDQLIQTHKHVLATKMACMVGRQSCIEMVEQEFQKYKTTGIRPNPDLRKIIYCNALKYSKNESDWVFLWNAYNTTNVPSEKNILLEDLGCTGDQNLIDRYLHYTLDPYSGIRGQDAAVVFNSVASNPKGVNIALEFLIDHYKQIDKVYHTMNALDKLIANLTPHFTTQDQVDTLTRFILSLEPSYNQFRIAAEKALKIAETNLIWINTYSKDLEDYYSKTNSASQILINFNLILIPIFCSFKFIL